MTIESYVLSAGKDQTVPVTTIVTLDTEKLVFLAYLLLACSKIWRMDSVQLASIDIDPSKDSVDVCEGKIDFTFITVRVLAFSRRGLGHGSK